MIVRTLLHTITEAPDVVVWYTIGLLVICASVMVVAAFADRRRGEEIARDPARLPVTPRGPRSHRDHP
jgi:hypothetical protein